MDAQNYAAATNPRVIASLSSETAEGEMALAGVHAEGIRIMGGRAAFLAVRVDAVEFQLAQRVKSAMLKLGADAAIEESAWAGSEKNTPLIILGTRRQFKDLFKTLSSEGGNAALLSEVIAQALDYYHRTAFSLRFPSGELRLGERPPAIMGILNVTPDSFSDGGKYLDEKTAVAHGVEMAGEGAGIIDIGGESTRPASMLVDAQEEARRVIPVIAQLSKKVKVPLSIDTSKASVAKAALDAGAAMINDVTALTGDPEMAPLAAARGCPVVLMHMKGTPRTMQKAPYYRELMGEIIAFLRDAIDRAVAAGVDRDQIVVDPGIGFGKTVEHNLEILQRLRDLSCLGRPVLVGPSRKSFLGKASGADVEDRAFATAGAVALATEAGAQIIRVHDVKAMRQVTRVAAAIAAGQSFEES
jgi:dihydropteroate synthase